MKRRLRIISTSISIVLVAALLSIGIFAATTAKVGGGNTISFTATDVFATVSMTESANGATASTVKFGVKDSVSFTDKTDTGTVGAVQTATLTNATLSDASKTYVLTITIKNDFDATQAIIAKATATFGTADLGYNADIQAGGAAYNAETGLEIAANTSSTIVITVSIPEDSKVAQMGGSSTFNFTLDLTKKVSA